VARAATLVVAKEEEVETAEAEAEAEVAVESQVSLVCRAP
tara:strand:- start:34035 stop:34154 length:120 start_codon:yes stop_codon:yes gene_type:complete